jgi:enoyl-[acyl-carrier protein] reductase I
MSSSSLLAGKRGVVFGFASVRSLAFSIADAWQQSGCEAITIGIQTERFRPALEKATVKWAKKPHVVVCDVLNDDNVKNAWDEISSYHGNDGIQMLAHSIAYASTAALKSPFIDTTRADFLAAHDASVYSLIALASGAVPLMNKGGKGGSIVSLSFIGGQRCVPSYKVMGAAKASLEAVNRQLAVELGPLKIRSNVLSPGPIDTLAARGIPGFTTLRDSTNARLPIGRGVDGGDVGSLAAFLASDAAKAITGQTINVDGGLSALA